MSHHDEGSGDCHHHCCCCHCGGGHHGHEEGHKMDWETHFKEMSKEELAMKKEKLEKKLALVNKLLGK